MMLNKRSKIININTSINTMTDNNNNNNNTTTTTNSLKGSNISLQDTLISNISSNTSNTTTSSLSSSSKNYIMINNLPYPIQLNFPAKISNSSSYNQYDTLIQLIDNYID